MSRDPKPTPVPRARPTPVRRDAVVARPRPRPGPGPAPTPVRAASFRAQSDIPASARKEAVRIDPRIKRRRIEVARDAGRKRLRVLFVSLGVVVLAVGLVMVTRSPVLDVDHVEVAGAVHTPYADIVTTGRLADSPQMLDVDTAAVARRIGKLPWVASATAKREWPATVRIDIVERKDVASLPAGEGKWAVSDADGHVLAVVDGRPDAMPSVAGAELADAPGAMLGARGRVAMQVAAALPFELRSKTIELVVLTDGTVDLAIVGGGVVRLGEVPAQLSFKLDAAVTVLRTLAPKSIGVLDVRVPRAPVLTRR